MKTLYESIDGKIFDTEEECAKHEQNLYLVNNENYILLNAFCQKITDSNTPTAIFNAHYIRVKNQEGVNEIRKNIKDFPNRIGDFYLDLGFGFSDMNYDYKQLRERLRQFELAKKRFDEIEKQNKGE